MNVVIWQKSISNVPPVMWLCLHISIFFQDMYICKTKMSSRRGPWNVILRAWDEAENRSFKKLNWNLDFFECRYFLNLNPFLDTVEKILSQILQARSPNVWKKFGLQAQTVLLTQIAHSSWALAAAPEIINIWGPQSHFYLHTKFCVFRGHDGKIRII